jgi:hypothetical protein
MDWPAMFESEEQKQRAEVIIMLLAKLFVVLELSPDTCPLCHKPLEHDAECPITLAWSMLSPEQQNEARTAIRAIALSMGCDDTFADPVVH